MTAATTRSEAPWGAQTRARSSRWARHASVFHLCYKYIEIEIEIRSPTEGPNHGPMALNPRRRMNYAFLVELLHPSLKSAMMLMRRISVMGVGAPREKLFDPANATCWARIAAAGGPVPTGKRAWQAIHAAGEWADAQLTAR